MEVQLVDILIGVVAYIAFLALTFAMMFAPEWLWKIEHKFDVKGGEPTDFYCDRMRIFGALGFVGGFLGGVFYLLYRLFG